MECARCGRSGTGRFCGDCGATLAGMPCPECGAEAPPGRLYCTACGARMRASSKGDSVTEGATTSASPVKEEMGWWVAGVLLAVLLVIGGWSVLSGGRDGAVADPPAGAGAGGALGPAPDVDLSSMSDREAADRLLNRVLTAHGQGDSVEVARFLPMALDAYDLARPLDADGRFHVALLEGIGGDHGAALATASQVLETDPDHLLLLGAAAEAALAAGAEDQAVEYSTHFLDVWAAEMSRDDRIEYREHPAILPEYRRRAEALVDGG